MTANIKLVVRGRAENTVLSFLALKKNINLPCTFCDPGIKSKHIFHNLKPLILLFFIYRVKSLNLREVK